jgi:SAM-dependent methyltransferase
MPFSPEYFDEIYREHADPWGLHTHFYEARKRALLLASLPRPRYRRAFEPACATGALTIELAPRCDMLLASDLNADAVARTARAVASHEHVQTRVLRLPHEWPDASAIGGYDLVVLSEFVYYLEAVDLDRMVQCIRSSLDEDATVVACHWNRRIAATVPLGRELHDRMHAQLHLPRLARHTEADFVLDVWTSDPRSVAQRDGLA